MSAGLMDLSPVSRAAVALLVDGENLSKDKAAAVLMAARRHGDVRVRRVYGAANHIAGWEDAGFRLVATRPGKNAADMLLCVEAAVLALREGIGTILIASSDRDFSYLAEQLREHGVHVVGVGEAKAPKAFREACSGFILLGGDPPKPAPAPVAEPMAQKVRAAIMAAGGAGLAMDALNPIMQKQGVNISGTPEGNWRKWLTARPALFTCDPKGPGARVRLKPHTAP
ncbi:MAG: NYN domain-containing protein [Paracoccaceae bacterium]